MKTQTFGSVLVETLGKAQFILCFSNGKVISTEEKRLAHIEQEQRAFRFKKFFGDHWMSVNITYTGQKQPYAIALGFSCDHFPQKYRSICRTSSSYTIEGIGKALSAPMAQFGNYIAEKNRHIETETMIRRSYEEKAKQLTNKLGIEVTFRGLIANRPLGFKTSYQGFELNVHEDGFVEIDLTHNTKRLKIPFNAAKPTLDTIKQFVV